MYSDEEDVSVKAYLVLHAIEDPFAKDDEIQEIVKVSRYYYHAKKEYFADNIENKPAFTSTSSGKLNCSSVVLSLHILNAFAAIVASKLGCSNYVNVCDDCVGTHTAYTYQRLQTLISL